MMELGVLLMGAAVLIFLGALVLELMFDHPFGFLCLVFVLGLGLFLWGRG